MHKLMLSLIFVVVFSLLIAETMIINLNNGDVIEFDLEEIEEITFGPDVSVEEMVEIISKIPIKFIKNYPNPFNPKTTIMFDIGIAGKVRVEIFNVKGQKVKTLINEKMEVGKHSVIWEGRDRDNKSVSSGMYFYKISVNGDQRISKMIMLK